MKERKGDGVPAPIVSRPDSARIHPTGVFDGSRAMQIINILRRQHAAEVVVDFSDVEGFEPFGVDVLLRELASRSAPGATIRCCGVPPCVTDCLDEIGVAVSSSVRHPRWAPWAP
ncbi:MAG: STAS domain-containing protein [Candidatus Rokubacteria bacterium]|nr:STAS domain-containing protein [Candidatus Rokubacteria bacterium]